jgi:hypothetical protein
MAPGPPSTSIERSLNQPSLKSAYGPLLLFRLSKAIAEIRIRFMKTIKYPWWKISLPLIILLAPCQQLNATVNKFIDANGTIHIKNIAKDIAKPENEQYDASVQHSSIEVVNPIEPTPSNIFPEPEGGNSLASNPNFQAPAPEP